MEWQDMSDEEKNQLHLDMVDARKIFNSQTDEERQQFGWRIQSTFCIKGREVTLWGHPDWPTLSLPVVATVVPESHDEEAPFIA